MMPETASSGGAATQTTTLETKASGDLAMELAGDAGSAGDTGNTGDTGSTPSINFRLLVRLANSIIQSGQIGIGNALRERHLGSAEANVLMFLYTEGDGVKQDDIVAGVEVSKAAISRTIALLARKGYLRRTPAKADRRSRLVFLTEKALKERTFIEEQFADMVVAASAGVPAEKVAEFIEVFRRVAANLEAYRRKKVTAW